MKENESKVSMGEFMSNLDSKESTVTQEELRSFTDGLQNFIQNFEKSHSLTKERRLEFEELGVKYFQNKQTWTKINLWVEHKESNIESIISENIDE